MNYKEKALNLAGSLAFYRTEYAKNEIGEKLCVYKSENYLNLIKKHFGKHFIQQKCEGTCSKCNKDFYEKLEGAFKIEYTEWVEKE